MTTLKTIKAIAARSQATLLDDLVGVAALSVLLIVGLHLPMLI